ncbi:MAG: hypothetical protein AAGA11_20855 [Pseudomonadota bacterium]
MAVVAYADSELSADVGEVTLSVNPETITRTSVTGWVSAYEPGATGAVEHPCTPESEDLSFDFVVDATGVVPGVASVRDEIDRFRTLAYAYDGTAHHPKCLTLTWDDQAFTGVLVNLSIAYELFSPTGEPLRATLSVTFNQHHTPQDLARRAEKTSVDLTRVQPVSEVPRRR